MGNQQNNRSMLKKVRECMTGEVVTLKEKMTVREASGILLKQGISGAPVIGTSGVVVGILSEKDCLGAILKEYEEGKSGEPTVDSVMSRTVWTINVDTPVDQASKIFLDTNFRRLPVLDEGRLVGQISLRDCLRGMMES